MTEDRSLDEFLGADEPGEPMDAGDPAVASDEDPEPSVEPMSETFSWSAAGGECAACGATVETRWRDGDALVCADCKAW